MKKPVQISLLSGFLLTFMLTKTLNVMQDTEIWRTTTQSKNHEVSNLGRIRSKDHITKSSGNDYRVKGKIRKPQIRRGYQSCQFVHKGKLFQIHQIVAQAFIDNPENKPYINHKNGIKTDNRVDNLEWCTDQENKNHAHLNGLMHPPKGTEHWKARLDDMQVKTIRRCLSDGMTCYKLAKYFKVSFIVITGIRDNVTYKDVS